MIDWAKAHSDVLDGLELYGTGTTGGRIADDVSLEIAAPKSRPLGGDAQLGATLPEVKDFGRASRCTMPEVFRQML